jgi:hypothetical protein
MEKATVVSAYFETFPPELIPTAMKNGTVQKVST